MISRRTLIASGTVFASQLFVGCKSEMKKPIENESWIMPDEAERHHCTYMAFASSRDIWGQKLLTEVQRNLATIAKTIAKYELVRMLVNANDLALAQQLVGSNPQIELVTASINDLWVRDSGPVFVRNGQQVKGAVDFNFNGWGNKQEHTFDSKVAALVSAKSNAQTVNTKLVLEGGGIEVDGQGTALLTRSCILNSNRNPGWSQVQVEAELKRLLGIEKFIWLPGIVGQDITDGHTDFYARFAGEGVVVAHLDTDKQSFDYAVTREHFDILSRSSDSKGRALQVVTIESAFDIRKTFASDSFAAGYINFYVCNGAVICPEFGDATADAAAKTTLKKLFPDRVIEQINIDGIAAGGGGIHCATQQEFA